MKTSISKFVLAAILLGAAHSAFAVLRLDHKVDLPASDGGALLTAFRENGTCAVWDYMPGRLVATGQFTHETGLSYAKYGDQTLSNYVTTMQMTASSGATQDDIQALKAAILNEINSDKECAGMVKTVSDIHLNQAFVQSANTLNTVKAGNNVVFGAIGPTYESPSKDYIFPMNPESITYVLDASALAATDQIRSLKLRSQSNLVNIGKISYILDGIVAKVDSHLVMNGEMAAKFVSTFGAISCHDSDSSDDAHGDILQGLAQKVTGVSFAGVEHHSHSCDFGYLPPDYRGGKLEMSLGIDHSQSTLDRKDPKTGQKVPIMVTPCDDKGQCGDQVSLEQYLNYQLLSLLLKIGGFDVQLKNASNATYALTLGRNGDSKTTYNADVSYKRSFEDSIGVDVNVYAKDLDSGSFNFNFENTALYKCVTDGFEKQNLQFRAFAGSQPMPVPDSCLGAGK